MSVTYATDVHRTGGLMHVEPRYASEWSDVTGEPDRRWLSAHEAQAAYDDEAGPSLKVVDGSSPMGEQAVRARWRIVFTPDHYVRVGWLDEHGSLLRESSYLPVGLRLFRTQITDWLYPDDRQRWLMYQALVVRTLTIDPSGTMSIVHRSPGNPTFERETVALDDPSGLWLEFPEFGHWEDILNPEHGLPGDPVTDPRLVDEWGLEPRESTPLRQRA
jgi:hypothetical protein